MQLEVAAWCFRQGSSYTWYCWALAKPFPLLKPYSIRQCWITNNLPLACIWRLLQDPPRCQPAMNLAPACYRSKTGCVHGWETMHNQTQCTLTTLLQSTCTVGACSSGMWRYIRLAFSSVSNPAVSVFCYPSSHYRCCTLWQDWTTPIGLLLTQALCGPQ